MTKLQFLDTLRLKQLVAPKFTAPLKAREKKRKAPSEPFHAVAVKTSGRCCAAARKLSGQRFLADEAPMLPLPGCDAASCKCSYHHFADRRIGPRRDPDDPKSKRRALADSRQNKGRRIEDREPDSESRTDYFRYAEETCRLPQLQPEPQSHPDLIADDPTDDSAAA